MENSNRSGTYKQLFYIPIKPTLAESFLDYKNNINKIGTGLAGTVIFFVFEIILNGLKIDIVLNILLKSFIFFVILSLLIIAFIYFRNIYSYYKQLENKVFGLRNFLLLIAGFENPKDYEETPLIISGISEKDGTVNIIINLPTKSNWLNIGSLLDVMSSGTMSFWGTIKIINIENDRAFGFPTDRKNIKFWEDLEDRMGKDQSPPISVYLEPHIPIEIRMVINYPLTIGEKIHV